MEYKSDESIMKANISSNFNRRTTERRLKKRRADNENSRYNGKDGRTASEDRRLTILNRQNMEVSDRRAGD